MKMLNPLCYHILLGYSEDSNVHHKKIAHRNQSFRSDFKVSYPGLVLESLYMSNSDYNQICLQNAILNVELVSYKARKWFIYCIFCHLIRHWKGIIMFILEVSRNKKCSIRNVCSITENCS